MKKRRRRKLTSQVQRSITAMYDDHKELTTEQIAELHGVSRASVARTVREVFCFVDPRKPTKTKYWQERNDHNLPEDNDISFDSFRAPGSPMDDSDVPF